MSGKGLAKRDYLIAIVYLPYTQKHGFRTMERFLLMAQEAAEEARGNILEAGKKLNQEAEKVIEDREKLTAEQQKWEEDKKNLEQKSAFGPNVTLNVGGITYRVSRMTLVQSIPRSHLLSPMFSGLHPPDEREESGVFFIDRNGKIFEHILEYLRQGFPAVLQLTLDPEPERSKTLYRLHEEAKYFQIPELLNDIRVLVGCDGISTLIPMLVPAAGLAGKGNALHVENGYSNHNKDYGSNKEQSITTTLKYRLDLVYRRVRQYLGVQPNQVRYEGYMRYCDLSGVTFKQCYFGPNMSFTGSVLFGVRFEDCAGLVVNKVRFSRKQIMESDMTEDLADALREAGCVHDEPVEIATD